MTTLTEVNVGLARDLPDSADSGAVSFDTFADDTEFLVGDDEVLAEVLAYEASLTVARYPRRRRTRR